MTPHRSAVEALEALWAPESGDEAGSGQDGAADGVSCLACGSDRSERVRVGVAPLCANRKGCRRRARLAKDRTLEELMDRIARLEEEAYRLPTHHEVTRRLAALAAVRDRAVLAHRVGEVESVLRRLRRLIDGPNIAEARLERLRAALEERGTMTRNDVYDLFGRNLTGAEAAAMVAAAAAEGWASESVVKGRGRPARVVGWRGDG